MVYNFLDKKTSTTHAQSETLTKRKKIAGNGIKNVNISNKELHKQIIKKFKKQKVYSSFIGNIWGADLADMPLISKFDKGIRFL